MNRPDIITIQYVKSTRTGLIAAITDEIPGFMVTGRTVDAVKAKLQEAISEALKEQFGVDFVDVMECDTQDIDGFVPLSPVKDWSKLRIRTPEREAA